MLVILLFYSYYSILLSDCQSPVHISIEAGVKMRETASCTMEKCKWLMPSHVKKVFKCTVHNISFVLYPTLLREMTVTVNF